MNAIGSLNTAHAAQALATGGLAVVTGVAGIHQLRNGHGVSHIIKGLGELLGASFLGATTAEHVGKAAGIIRTDGTAYTRY